jgi:KUP system potassium uptake protein
MLAGSPISWQAKKQSTIALSTAEAEYAALTQAAKEAIWLQNLLKDLRMSKYAPRVINVDNQGTIALANNPIHHARTKHLDVQLQFVRDSIENGIIELQYCPTDVMFADIMTKALAKDKHATMRKLIGMDSGNTSASPVEDVPIGQLRDGRKAPSGSVELRHLPRGDPGGIPGGLSMREYSTNSLN